MFVAHLFGSYWLWPCKGSSQAAEDSWFPIGEDECHDMRTGDPGSKKFTCINAQLFYYLLYVASIEYICTQTY